MRSEHVNNTVSFTSRALQLAAGRPRKDSEFYDREGCCFSFAHLKRLMKHCFLKYSHRVHDDSSKRRGKAFAFSFQKTRAIFLSSHKSMIDERLGTLAALFESEFA